MDDTTDSLEDTRKGTNASTSEAAPVGLEVLVPVGNPVTIDIIITIVIVKLLLTVGGIDDARDALKDARSGLEQTGQNLSNEGTGLELLLSEVLLLSFGSTNNTSDSLEDTRSGLDDGGGEFGLSTKEGSELQLLLGHGTRLVVTLVGLMRVLPNGLGTFELLSSLLKLSLPSLPSWFSSVGRVGHGELNKGDDRECDEDCSHVW